MSHVPDVELQPGMIFNLTLPVPRRLTKLGETTGPRTAHLKRPVKPLG